MELEKYLIEMVKQELESFSNTDNFYVKKSILNRMVGFLNDIDNLIIKKVI